MARPAQTLIVGAHARFEFRRLDGGLLDVEMLRSDGVALRDRLALAPGREVFLRPRCVTRFAAVSETG